MAYMNSSGQVRIGVRPAVTAQQLQTATYLFDGYGGAAAAYSLRRLSATYSGSAIRVRRSVDNAEQNIGFDANGGLDTSSLLSFANVSDTSTTKLLDLYSGAAVAYSLRKLSSTYSGSAIRVRRSSDNAEQNIGFNSDGSLDTNSLLTFIGGGDGFVKTWYDQSGNNNHANQLSAVNQPQIVSSGSVLTVNSKSCIRFDGSNDNFSISTPITLSAGDQFSSFHVERKTTAAAIGLWITSSPSVSGGYTVVNYGETIYMSGQLNTSTSTYKGGPLTGNPQRVISGYLKSIDTNSQIYVNNSLFTSYNNSGTETRGASFITMGSRQGEYSNTSAQELILYKSDKSSDNNAINNNINSYYSTFTPTGNAFVTTWYDQSGNSKDAAQTTSASQPQIVSNGSLILLSGRTSLYFGGSSYLITSQNVVSTGNAAYSVFGLGRPQGSPNCLFYIGIPSGNNGIGLNNNNGTPRHYWFANDYDSSQTFVNTNSIFVASYDGTKRYTTINNVTTSANSSGKNTISPVLTIGKLHTWGQSLVGHESELIIYDSNKESVRSNITSDLNSYYSIWDSSIVQSGLVMNLDASFKSSYPGTGTTWTDISYNGNNGTLTNGPVFGTSSGGQIAFDGVNDFAKIPLNLSSYSQITVEIWYKMNPGGSNLAAWGGMLWEHSSDWNSNPGAFGLAVNSGGCSNDLNLMHTNHNGGSGAINYQFNSGTTWSCHVNIFSNIADSTGRLVYVNGQLKPFVLTNTCSGVAFSTSTATTNSTAFRNDFLYLSSRNGQSGFINGNIGLIRIYGRKLSATEVLQNFNATKSRFGL